MDGYSCEQAIEHRMRETLKSDKGIRVSLRALSTRVSAEMEPCTCVRHHTPQSAGPLADAGMGEDDSEDDSQTNRLIQESKARWTLLKKALLGSGEAGTLNYKYAYEVFEVSLAH